MSDLADEAQADIEIGVLNALYNAKRRTGPVATGFCLNCDEPLPGPHAFCDAGCRDDYQKRQRMAGFAPIDG